MIAAGRDVVDRAGIAELHGLTMRQARRAKPWTEPGHPEPITPGRATRGRPTLWDYEQAAAFAAGKSAPSLPASSTHEDDLLDRFEAAELAGVAATAWEQDQYRGRVPPPDETVYDIPMWYRDTVTAYRQQRALPRIHRGGRPPGSGEPRPRAELRAAVEHLLRDARDADEVITTAAIARQLGIHYSTALRHVHAVRGQDGE